MAHCWYQSGWGYSTDCHVSINVLPFLPGLDCYSLVLSSTFLRVVLHLLISSAIAPHALSISPNCIGMTSSLIFVCCMLYFMSQIYSMESPINTILSTNSMGLAHARPIDTCTYCGQQTSCVASLSSEHTLWDNKLVLVQLHVYCTIMT